MHGWDLLFTVWRLNVRQVVWGCRTVQRQKFMIWMRKQRGLGEGDLGAKGCNISLSDIIESASVSGLCTDHDLEDNSVRAQSCPTLCNPMDWSPLDSFHGILQAGILEWVVSSSSRLSFQHRNQTCVSCLSCTAGRFFPAEPPREPRRQQRTSNHPLIELLFQWEMGKPDSKQGDRQISFRSWWLFWSQWNQSDKTWDSWWSHFWCMIRKGVPRTGTAELKLWQYDKTPIWMYKDKTFRKRGQQQVLNLFMVYQKEGKGSVGVSSEVGAEPGAWEEMSLCIALQSNTGWEREEVIGFPKITLAVLNFF